MITGYGGKEIPPFSRTYIGGEQDIRGFQIWGISPIAFIPSEATINVLNNDGSQRMQLVKNSYGVLTPVTGDDEYSDLPACLPGRRYARGG